MVPICQGYRDGSAWARGRGSRRLRHGTIITVSYTEEKNIRSVPHVTEYFLGTSAQRSGTLLGSGIHRRDDQPRDSLLPLPSRLVGMLENGEISGAGKLC